MTHRRSIHILLALSTLLTLLVGLFAPFYALFVEKIGGGIEIAGISWAVFSIVSGVLILLFTMWETHVVHKRKLLLAGLFLRALAFLSFVFITSITDLILAQVLMGISIALTNPSYDALFTHHTTEQKAISDWGGWEGLTSIAAGVASVTGGFLIKYFGYETVFLTIAACVFCMALYLSSVPKEML